MGKNGSKSSRRVNQKSKPAAKAKAAKVKARGPHVSDFEKERRNMIERNLNKTSKNAPKKMSKLEKEERHVHLSNALEASQNFGVDRRSLTTVLSAATSSLGVPVTLQAQHKYEKEEQQQPDNPFAAFAYSSSDDDDDDEADEQARMEKKLEKEREKSNVFDWKAPTLGVVDDVDDDL
ncbi:hypothetical protein TL16_g07885 [Triparma laevis f. inornata]|uniref:Uncharacterized protein n=1 Tax=Triparma laevis f. inornata TaxID=1714386 RepID=A0A9W7EI06_9STRA|nr:hypothetical protein TL16_g07885 [Triparma laevis f. inornata]